MKSAYHLQTAHNASMGVMCNHDDDAQAKSVPGTLALASMFAIEGLCDVVDQTVYVLVLATGQGDSDICLSLCLL